MKKITILVESGSDVNADLAQKHGIEVVPMHVTFENETRDDATFDPEYIVDYYRSTGKLPKTSGCTPEDFAVVFDALHQMHPEAHIIYLAYSAVTTCSFASATIAAEDRDYITLIDTKQVSVGQGCIAMTVADFCSQNPNIEVAEAVAFANDLISRANMCFMPNDLEFLRAGGRVSNVAFLGSRILNLHPCIEILDGKLVATKKYRGKMEKVAVEMVNDYAEKYNLDRSNLWFVYTVGMKDEIKACIEEAAKKCGFANIMWIRANAVITTHGGPAAFGLAGFSKK